MGITHPCLEYVSDKIWHSTNVRIWMLGPGCGQTENLPDDYTWRRLFSALDVSHIHVSSVRQYNCVAVVDQICRCFWNTLTLISSCLPKLRECADSSRKIPFSRLTHSYRAKMRAYFHNQIFIILSIILLTKYAVCARNYMPWREEEEPRENQKEQISHA